MVSINRFIRKTAAGAAVCLLTISTSMSDDIDVYVTPGTTAFPGETYVIFTLDLRPNVLASEVCTGDECDALFTDEDVGMGEALEGHTSYLELLTAALKKVLRTNIAVPDEEGNLISPPIKVALMVPHNDTTGGNRSCVGPQGDGPECSNGAYVLSAFKSTTDDPNTLDVNESQQLEEFFERLESIPFKDGGNWGHPYQLKELFFEMYRYMTAGRVFNGRNGLDNFGTDDSLNIDHVEDTISVHPAHIDDPADPEYTQDTAVAELSWDPTSQRNNELDQPFYQNTLETAQQCSQIFSINFVDGTASSDDDSDAAIQAPQPDGMGIALDGSNFRSRIQVLEFLARTDLDENLLGNQNITSYFIAQGSGGSGNIGGRASDWAQAGGTETAFIATADPQELVDLISGLFNEIIGVSTTFVAASVPANVFNRAETLNEVFLAIFEPDAAKHPFWVGNVKKLTTATIEETIDCVDTNGDDIEDECTTEERKALVDVLEARKDTPTTSAINPTDGRIRSGALTYWTRTGIDNEYLPPPDPDNQKDQLEFEEGADGRKVDRGGAGQVKPGYLSDGSPGEANGAGNTDMSGPRKLFTEPDELNDATLVDALVELNGASDNTVAADLLADSRPYPGTSDGTTYGDYLFQTVMNCDACSYDPDGADADTAQLRVSNLVRYARGFDLDVDPGLDTPLSTSLSKRAWWQADPLHSRPLALNYGARGDFTNERPDIRILVAGNDGLVQMIRDGRTSDDPDLEPGDAEDGVEAWAFLPREFVPLQKRLWQGTQGDYLPGQPIADGADPRIPLHPYAMDGGPTALVIDNNLDGTIDTSDDDRVYAFLGQRRGGKRFYALDLSNPDDPKYLWSIGKNDPGDDFAEMGQSWSLLRAGVMRVTESTGEESTGEFNRPVLVFSGGYNGDDGGDGDGDLGKDSRVKNHNANTEVLGTDDDEGNALFIVNALTGELIWKAIGTSETTASYDSTIKAYKHPDLVDSVASSPTIVDSDGNGQIDRVYFPDTGGNVWRMDAGGPNPANWTVTKLFSGGRHITANAANDRRFFNAPDVVFAQDDAGDFDAVILASGDRARPLGTEAENWIYMIKDRATLSGNPSDTTLTPDDLADLTDNCLQADPDNFDGCTDADAATNIENGWKIQLEQCQVGGTDPKCGEKSLASPLTIEGTIFLTSYLPQLEATDEDGDGEIDTQETCGPKEGDGLFYALDLQTAAGVLEFDPSNNAGGVEVPDRFDKLRSPGIPPEPVAISPQEVLRPDLQIQKTEGRKSSKTFWYERRFN